jgi:hypothetical protein
MAYDAFLVKTGLANTRKFRRLTAAEGWCAVMGVWSIAAQATPRGYLLIADGEPATEKDFAEEAKVTVAVARSTVKKMRALGMIEIDNVMGIDHVHDWHEIQKDPKPSDSPAAWRERKREERARKRGQQKDSTPMSLDGHTDVPRDNKASHADVTPPIEVKGSKGIEEPPDPPQGGRSRDQQKWEIEMAAWVAAHPVTPELSEILEPVVMAVSERVGESTAAIWLSSLHAHSADVVLVLGAHSSRAGWVREHYSRALQDAAGMPVRVIDCGCEQAIEQAA